MAKNVFDPLDTGKSTPRKPPKVRTRPTIVQEFRNLGRSMLPTLELNADLVKKVGFVTFLMMVYIALNHSHITTLNKIETAKKNLASERALYLNLKGQHERQQRQSELSKTLKEVGSEVGLASEPSKKIVVKIK